MTKFKRFILVLVTLFYSSTVLLPPVYAGPWFNQTPEEFATKVNTGDPNEIFGERYTFAQVNWIINSLYLMLNPMAGLDPNTALTPLIQGLTCILNPSTSGCPGASIPNPYWQLFANLGIPGLMIGNIAEMTSHPAASGILEINKSLANFDIASPVQAQGYGFSTLDGLRVVWGASRNMAYLLMVVLLIATGFMIMFRVKINPQTAVSLQIMIPKVIFTLLLVTFSYAIAGLVIDLVYVILAFVISGLTLTSAIDPGSLSNSVGWFFKPDYGQITVYYIGAFISFILGGFNISNLISNMPVVGDLIGGAVGTLSAIIGIIIAVIVAWLLFKVWWMMVKTYLTLMFLIVIGPWQIMLGLLPGQQGFGTWFRNVIANASVFLTVPIMFMMNMFFWPVSIGSPLGGVADPASATFPDFPLFHGKGEIFGFAIGFAILSMIPKVADIIRDALKVPPFKYGTAVNEALGVVPGAYNRYQANQKAQDERALTAAKLQETLGRGPSFMSQGPGYEAQKLWSNLTGGSQNSPVEKGGG